MLSVLFLSAALLLAQEGGAAPATTQDPAASPLAEDPLAVLAAEYDAEVAGFVAERRAAEEAGRAFRREHPVRVFWTRFELLSRLGDGRATLWLLRHTPERNLGEEGVVAVKRALLGELVERHADEPWMEELVAALPEEERWLSPRLVDATLAELGRSSASAGVRAAAAWTLAERVAASDAERASELWRAARAEAPESDWARRAARRLLALDYERAVARGEPSDARWLLANARELLAAEPGREASVLRALERVVEPAAGDRTTLAAELAAQLSGVWRVASDRPRLLRALYRYLNGADPREARAQVASALADLLLAEPGQAALREAAAEVYRFCASLDPDTWLGRRARERALRAERLGPGGTAPSSAGTSLRGEPTTLAATEAPLVLAFLELGRSADGRAAQLLAELATDGVVIVASDADLEALRARRTALPEAWRVVSSPDGTLQRAWGVHEDAAVFVLGRAGRILADLPLDEQLVPRLRVLLGE